MARAFQRLLAAEGLPRVTFARVAAEAGISVGLIQHYFANKDELLRFSYEDCLRTSATRVQARIRAGEAAAEPISAMLLASLTELLPLDAERTREFRVERNLWLLSLHNPDLAAVAGQATDDLHARIATAIENGKECGEVRPETDSPAAASMILATARGCADSLSLQPSPADPATVEAVLRPVISTVFTGRCHHYDRRSAGA